jgi:hypothetical protein
MKMPGEHHSWSAYLDGAMSAPERSAAEEHLAECGECRAELEQLRTGRAAMAHLPLASAPESVWRSIERGLAEIEPPRKAAMAWWRWAAVAAVLLVSAGTFWRLGSGAGSYWEVTRADEGPDRVPAGEWLETGEAARVRIKVGVIGTVEMQPGTRLRLLATRPAGHRMALESGEIHARIAAPPRLFFVETAAGTAVDLGCEYTLRCDRQGNGMLRVTMGWVAYESGGVESLVPAGAVCLTRTGKLPGIPYFEDAPRELIAELDRFETSGGGVDGILAAARVRDTLTLWHLLWRVPDADRVRVYNRMAALSPPPAEVSREQALRLDRNALQRWREELAWTW